MSKRFPFTKRSIEAIPSHDPESPSREAEYSDSECIGLKLRVSKNGRRFFQHRYRICGKKKCLTIGEYPHVTIKEAKQRVSEHKSLLARGIDPSEERNQKTNDLTFSEFAESMYIPHIKHHKLTFQDDIYRIRGHIKKEIGQLTLSSINARDLTSFHNKIKELNTATTANHYLVLIRRMLNLAVQWDVLKKNPAAGLEKFREPPLREKYLSKEELPRFLKALEEHSDQISMAAIKLLLLTGARKSEILSLKFNMIRLEEGRIHLPKTKNGSSHSLILSTEAIKILEELLQKREEGQEYVFPSRAGAKKGHLHDLRKPLQKVCEAAGIDGLRVHDLRHSYASIAAMNGVSLYEISKLLNHKNPEITKRYSHIAQEDLQRATDKVSSHISEVFQDK